MRRTTLGLALLLGAGASAELGACQLTQCVRHSDCGTALVCDAGLCSESLPVAQAETEGGGSDGGADPGMAGGSGGMTPSDPGPAADAGDEGGAKDDDDDGHGDAQNDADEGEDGAGSSDGGDGPHRDPEDAPEVEPPRRNRGGSGG